MTPRRLPPTAPLSALLTLGLLAAVGAALAAQPDAERTARERVARQNHLKQIVLAFHNYESAYGVLPAAGFSSVRQPTPPGGTKPLLSWRVAILTYIESGTAYREFHQDEPWDSEHNKKLLDRMPKVYEQPGRPAPKGYTYYQVFTGKDTIFDGGKQLKLVQIPDGLSNTILVVEGAEAVPWTKPEDIPFTAEGPLPKLPEEFLVGMCDGSARYVNRKKVSDQTLRYAIMHNDGQVLGPDWGK
jgi:hypothetical protein